MKWYDGEECMDCGREIYYDEEEGGYHHVIPIEYPRERPCFLIPEVIIDGVMVQGEWVPDREGKWRRWR